MASIKEHATRFGMLLLAVLFLLTTVGVTIVVIWQVNQQSKQEKAAQAALTAQQQAQSQTQKNDSTQPKEGKLEGTQLQDFTPGATVTTLQSTDIVVGTGAEVKEGDTITAHYTGALVKDGKIFQSSHDTGQPFTAQLVKGGLIDGWVQGIPGMKEGGKRRLVIPAALAYGPQEQPGIPANSDLVFDVELVKVGK